MSDLQQLRPNVPYVPGKFQGKINLISTKSFSKPRVEKKTWLPVISRWYGHAQKGQATLSRRSYCTVTTLFCYINDQPVLIIKFCFRSKNSLLKLMKIFFSFNRILNFPKLLWLKWLLTSVLSELQQKITDTRQGIVKKKQASLVITSPQQVNPSFHFHHFHSWQKDIIYGPILTPVAQFTWTGVLAGFTTLFFRE